MGIATSRNRLSTRVCGKKFVGGVISYQLSDVSFQFTVYCLLKKGSPLPHFPLSSTP
ncbi:hypothetical protein C789_815 [Microcystis aeruginosa FACHB-905 = DIANCHI905]|uniref:Uncharacterized protein n=1 Tax=Microcystis panniformis FACHB-1757 TaxID=1638788 RepID=A0A0K1RXV0_9CHRO|nr:hypothetical protein VL20_1375 [Microcystis panniformis FACHB-1757]ELS49356.1 hypothetical protein C789_815 [Microcystis aeruginosa FACHB-905 = DIANCHI905]